jgi:LysM repeat protein
MTEEKAEYLKFVALLVVMLAAILILAALSPRLIGRGAPAVLGLDRVVVTQPDQAIEETPETAVEPENAAAPEGAAPVEMEIEGLQHEVQPGQTLFQIAELYGVSVQDLAAANHLVNPLQLQAGAILIIPQSR